MLVSAETKLGKLRDLMKCSRLLPDGVPALTAYIIPSEDAHYSEYTAPQHKRRQFISAFTGSAGTAVVTMDKVLNIVRFGEGGVPPTEVYSSYIYFKKCYCDSEFVSTST